MGQDYQVIEPFCLMRDPDKSLPTMVGATGCAEDLSAPSQLRLRVRPVAVLNVNLLIVQCLAGDVILSYHISLLMPLYACYFLKFKTIQKSPSKWNNFRLFLTGEVVANIFLP